MLGFVLAPFVAGNIKQQEVGDLKVQKNHK